MINICIFAVKLRLYQEMNKPKIDLLFSGVLFSILGLLVWFILANYVGAPKNIMKIFSSPWAGLFMGHRTKRILRIERKEYQTY